MKIWSKIDLAGLLLVLFGITCLIFSKSAFLTSSVLACASLLLLHGIYNSRYDAIRFREMLCHYQAILSSSSDAWIAWSINNEYIGASKKARMFFGIKSAGDINVSDILNAIVREDAEDFSFRFNKLKKVGTGFKIVVRTNSDDNKIEITGARMIIDGIETVVLWCANITTSSGLMSTMEAKLKATREKTEMLYEVLNTLPIPVWRRNDKSDITYCNKTYADFLDIDVEKVLLDNVPLVAGSLFGQGHSLAENARKCNRPQSISQFVVINGTRRKLNINENPVSNENTVGFAIDVTAEENLSSNLDRVVTANCEVLETLSTAIAIFGENTRLTFFNSAYQKLMKLETNWLHANPSFSEILDECRDNRQLPEYADFQVFKKEQLALFTSVTSPIQQLMHLPNGKTLRLVIAPYPLGGLLFMYEDVTDSLALQRKNSTLLAVQKETIDHLYEGVMVFGSDNRLKIVNNAMLKMWKLEAQDLSNMKGMHLSEMLDAIKEELDYGADWEAFKENAISNLTDRITKTGKLLKKDNSVILFSYVPLPDGAHMHSFIDITDTCVVERAVMEKNQALKTAQKLRFEFVSGISTELKEPLNILIGFAELLMHQYFGALNDKQLEYCRCILGASNQLHQLINNLLEMVSIDIDSVKLELSQFSIQDVVNEVISSVDKRAAGKSVEIVSHFAEDVPEFNGDKTRIKQALFNIMINALQFTPPGGKVDIRVAVDDKNIKIIVKDEGIGLGKNGKKKVFSRSNTVNFLNPDSNNISMPLVRSLIELHGGSLNISSDVNDGTSVICSLPLKERNAEVVETSNENDGVEVAASSDLQDVVNL
ncbi:MAG: PAS-domain containing protein [Alphaproteobacteria bacterium]|nr:PAS-domain containing protein [Alphaproteobacteria bacterium]